MTKETIISALLATLDAKLNTVKSEIEKAQNSKNKDTKSSMGDKYETGREMIQLELNRLQALQALLESQKNKINKISLTKKFMVTDTGSLVKTNKGTYFISIGIGKMSIQEKDIFVISLASPIGKLMKGKKRGDSFQLNHSSIEIIELS